MTDDERRIDIAPAYSVKQQAHVFVNMRLSQLQGETFRERGAEMKQFETKYYNVDVHRAALAMPEFLREALGE